MKYFGFAKMSPYAYPFYIMLHPRDGFQELKFNKKGSNFITAAIIFVWFLVEAFYQTFADYDYNESQGQFRMVILLLSTVGMFIIFTCANWCFSTLMDGKGTYSLICTTFAYALMPYILVKLITTILGWVMVLDEAIILQYSLIVAVIWCLFILFSGLQEIHEYDEGSTVKSLFLTILGVLIILFIVLLLATIVQQMSVFIKTIFLELFAR